MGNEPNDAARQRWQRLEALFDIALDLDPAQREAFLRRWQGEHPDLIGELRRLLAAAEAETSPLDQSPQALIVAAARTAPETKYSSVETSAATPPPSALHPGARLGPWRVIEHVADGGMGSVYAAERADGAFEMRVAIKLIRGERVDLAKRLEAERALLARLDHPGIARLLDGGLSPAGHPYLVMEWVEGRPIDAWALHPPRRLDERLRAFEQVARAVAYAHRHLIVHRDIKPGNVLVSTEGQVKLLDFGIARLLDDTRTLAETGAAALTPEYAAPEQLSGKPVTTRTDIYALGGLLYELLTGCAPLELNRMSLMELVRRVCEVDPQPASQATRVEAGGLPASLLAGDLDAILAKALHKDPERRYQSVDALLDDLRAHAEGRPVKARPPSLWYRGSRMLRRHWLSASLVATIILVLAGATATLAWQSHQLAAERDQARFESARSDAVREYLVLMLRNAAADAGGGQIDTRAMLDRAAERIESEFASAPQLRDSVMLNLAELYSIIGDFRGAEPLIDRYLELATAASPAPELAFAHDLKAVVALRLGDPAGALRWSDLALAYTSAGSGLREGALANVLSTRGAILRALARHDEAVEVLERAVALRISHDGAVSRPTAVARNSLAAALASAGRLEEALAQFEATAAIWQSLGMDASADAATTLANWASIAFSAGRLEQAKNLFERALQLRSLHSMPSGGYAALLSNYARLLLVLDQAEQAAGYAREALEMIERATGADSLDSAAVRLALAEADGRRGAFVEALGAFDAVENVFAQRLGAEHPALARVGLARASLFARRGEAEAALSELDRIMAPLRAAGPGLVPVLATALCLKGELLLRQRGDRLAAAPCVEECRALRNERLPLGSWERHEAELLAIATQPEAADATQAAARLEDFARLLGAEHSRVTELRLLVQARR